MPSILVEYRLRIRNIANTADLLYVSTIRGDAVTATTGPYLKEPPRGDGASFNPLTSESLCASYTGVIVDAITSGMSRIVTAQLEDAPTPPVAPQQQLGYRVAFVESRTDGGTWAVLCAGYLVGLHLTSAITWEFTVQDGLRTIGGFQAFTMPGSMSMAAVMAKWPLRGLVFGGPLTGKFLDVPATIGQPWLMKVRRAGASGSFNYYFEFVTGAGGPDWKPSLHVRDFADPINNAVQGLFQYPRVEPHLPSFLTVQDALTASWWSGLVFLVQTPTPTFYRPVPASALLLNLTDDDDAQGSRFRLVRSSSKKRDTQNSVVSRAPSSDMYNGVFAVQDGQPDLADGQTIVVQCLTIQPSEISPIYWNGHPADLLEIVLQQAGLIYYPTGISNLKTAIGTTEQIAVRITGDETVSGFLQKTVFAPYGVGMRVGTIGDPLSSGKLVPFLTRHIDSAILPTATVTDADIVQGEVRLPFELDVATGINRVQLTQKVLRVATTVSTGLLTSSEKLDGITVVDTTGTWLNGDPGTVPSGSLSLDVNGMLHQAGSKEPYGIDWLKKLAATAFDRFGRGNVQGEWMMLRGTSSAPTVGDAINLGDEALINISQLPNHNYRIGDNPATPARRMQAMQITENPHGRLVRWSDSGPTANQIPTVPVLSIAVTSDKPRTIAQFTITNAATLNASGYGARVEIATTPAGAPAPAASDFGGGTFYDDGNVATTPQRIGPFTAGLTIYVRARTERKRERASNWGATVGVSLSSVANPTGLTATPDGADGSLCLLTWTPGAGTSQDTVDVYVRLATEAFSQGKKIETLSPGSVRYLLQNLVPGTAYIASVQYRDSYSHDTSDEIDVAFTAGASTRVLSAPVYPFPFAGSRDEAGIPRRDGIYGIGVLAAELPGLVEVAIALETGIGTDVYGSFVIQPTPVPSILGNWTTFSLSAPNDGRCRKLKARHVATGATSSAYSTPDVTVLPWTPRALPPLPSTVIVDFTPLDPSPPTDAGIYYRFQVAGVDPLGMTPQVEIQSLSSNMSVASGPAIGVLSPNDTAWRVAMPTTGGVGTVTLRAQTPDGRFSDFTFTVPESTIASSLTMRLDRVTANDSTIDVHVHVADPTPSVDPLDFITIKATSQGVTNDDAVSPVGGNPIGGAVVADDGTQTADLIPPGDVVTNNLDTTDFVHFVITRPDRINAVTGLENPSGLVNFTATREGRTAAVQSINVEPKGVSGAPTPTITVESEGSARDGHAEGQVRLKVTLEPNTKEIYVYASESATLSGATPNMDHSSQAGIIRRREGLIAEDDYFKMELDVSTTPGWYRQMTAVLYPTNPKGARLPPMKFYEGHAVDAVGTAPTAPPTLTSVTPTVFNGEPRNTVLWANGDASAETRVFRNEVFLKRFGTGVTTFADDGLTPGVTYTYKVQHVRNGQTSEFSSGGGATGGGGSPTVLATPTWATGYPKGGRFHSGLEPDAYVNVRVASPADGVTYEVWMNDNPADSGTFSFTGVSVMPGSSDATVLADSVGAVSGYQRWFYLVAIRTDYANSLASTHKIATFGGDHL